ncbi:hypothetical protein WN943_027635 [Citrus x changshan-huyou]
MGEVLYSAMEFFNLPSEEKLKFMSSDVYKPARYGTRLRDGADKIQFWRVFLKHYASPLEDKNPPKHRSVQSIVKISALFSFYHHKRYQTKFAYLGWFGGSCNCP